MKTITQVKITSVRGESTLVTVDLKLADGQTIAISDLHGDIADTNSKEVTVAPGQIVQQIIIKASGGSAVLTDKFNV